MTVILEGLKLRRQFGELVAVSDVDFTVSEGEILALIGPNGAGKSTLFNLLTGQLQVTSGEVKFEGNLINDLPPHLRSRRGMGRTFQIAKPFLALSALENATVGALQKHRSPKIAAEHAYVALSRVGLSDKAGVAAHALTLSDRRRLEVARALATEPSLILLDEVMAGLNATECALALELFKELNSQGMTFVVIEHNLKVVRTLSDRTIVLDQGAVIAEGSPSEVLNHPDVVRAYVGGRAK